MKTVKSRSTGPTLDPSDGGWPLTPGTSSKGAPNTSASPAPEAALGSEPGAALSPEGEATPSPALAPSPSPAPDSSLIPTPESLSGPEPGAASIPATAPAAADESSTPLVGFDGKVLRLRGTLDVFHAQELRVELIKVANHPPEDLVVDLSELEHLDAAAAQILIAFRREVPRARLTAPTDAVREGLERVGVWRAL